MSLSYFGHRAVTTYGRRSMQRSPLVPGSRARVMSVDMSEMSFAPKRLAGCVFDMDGTITQPHAIDFKAMRARAGVPPGMDIIEYIDSLPDTHHHLEDGAHGAQQQHDGSRLRAESQSPARGHSNSAHLIAQAPGLPRLTPRQAAMRAVEDEERKGVERMQLMPDAYSLLQHLQALGIPRALLTRNNAAAMEQTITLFQEKHSWDTDSKGRPFDLMLCRDFRPCKPHPAAIHHIAEQWGVHPSGLVMVGDHSDDMQCGRAAGATTVLIGDDTSAVPWADHVVGSLTELKELLSRLYALPAVPAAS